MNYMKGFGCEVSYENTDGQVAYKVTGELLSDSIFVKHEHKPSHGRPSVISINKRKKTSQIPIHFVDRAMIENRKIEGIAEVIKFEEIENILKRKLATETYIS